jgi:hypothetical protein
MLLICFLYTYAVGATIERTTLREMASRKFAAKRLSLKDLVLNLKGEKLVPEKSEQELLQMQIREIEQEIEIANQKITNTFDRISEVSDSLIIGYYLERERSCLKLLEIARAPLNQQRLQQVQIYDLERVFKDFVAMEKEQYDVEMQRQYDVSTEQLAIINRLKRKKSSQGLSSKELKELNTAQPGKFALQCLMVSSYIYTLSTSNGNSSLASL